MAERVVASPAGAAWTAFDEITVAKLLNDFSEQRTSAKRLKWIKGIAVIMFLLALTAAGKGPRSHSAAALTSIILGTTFGIAMQYLMYPDRQEILEGFDILLGVI